MKIAIVLFAIIGLGLAAPQENQRDLISDFEDFINLLPVEKLLEISNRFLSTDAEVQQVVKYLQGDDWAALVQAVSDKPAWIEFKVYLTEAGVPIEDIIQFLHDLLQNANPGSVAASTRGMREFIDEILSVMPVGDLLIMLNDKLTNSEEFIALFTKLSSDDARLLFNEVRAMEEVQRLAAVLKEMGMDIDLILDIIYAILGW